MPAINYLSVVERYTPEPSKKHPYPREQVSIVSASRYESYGREAITAIAMTFAILTIAGLIMLGGEALGGDNPAWYITGGTYLLAGSFLFFGFYFASPALSVFPRLFGSRITMLEDNAQDQKLVALLEGTDIRIAPTWMRTWAQGSVEDRDRVLSDIKSAIKAAKKARKQERTTRRAERKKAVHEALSREENIEV